MRKSYSLVAVMIYAAITSAQPNHPSEDAWPLYEKAAAHIAEGDRQGKSSPAASNLEYLDFPPFPPEWHRLAKQAYEFNTSAFEQIRKARTMRTARWPAVRKDGDIVLLYFSNCRNIANEIADAALYQHVQGNDAEAIEYVRDELHLADLLDADPQELAIHHALVAVGVRASALNRLEVISSDVSLTADPSDHKRLQVDVVKGLIRQLFTNDDLALRIKDLVAHEAPGTFKPDSIERLRYTLQRGQMERNLAAMSLACHLCRFEKSHWPASLDEVTAYLPGPPADAWGALGYALIRGGLPDGSDRPLVYSHLRSKDGMFYRIDEPQYGFYVDDGTTQPANLRKEGGQFRDVSLWAPAKNKSGPTTRPLQ